jgi:DNA (cytosine-5)-methyltransferase 1
MITFADLFAGIGGFRLGIEQASEKLGIPVKCVFSSEIEKNAVKIYEKNFKETPSGDITKIHTDDIANMDLLCGGFPCQSFSIAGKRGGFNDTRGTLFFEIARIAEHKRPKMLFLENVKGLLNHDHGRTFGTILVTLDELGYDVEWQVLNSKDFGVPQNRERVFIIGHSRSRRTRQIFPIYGETGATTRENSSTCLDANYWKGIDNHGARTAIIQHYCGGHQQDRVLDPLGISSCLPTGTGGDLMPKFIVGGKIRKLTPVECERLQSYPDSWTEGIADSNRYKCLGNAVTVNVIEAIAEKILTELNK